MKQTSEKALLPDVRGHYGRFGGKYVPETLMPPLAELEQAYREARLDQGFLDELGRLLADYAGRPTPLYQTRRLAATTGGAKILLKREDLCHTGSHKLNNTLGQALLATRLGKRRLIAETGAGQHGVATATAAALLGLECAIFMGSEDTRRQALNVWRMRLLGAEVVEVTSGSRTLKDAVNAALRDWAATFEDTYYCMGSVVGPHPFPMMVRDFQSVIGKEARSQFLEVEGKLPDALVACVGGGSNSMGLFHPFQADGVRMIGVEAGGRSDLKGQHSATLGLGEAGVLHGAMSYLLQNDQGQIAVTHSVSAGLDYPGVGPEHSFFKETGRAEYVRIGDDEALAAAARLTRTEGILPALESAHAVAYAVRLAANMPSDAAILVCLSGRGDKDVETMRSAGLDRLPDTVGGEAS